MSKKPFKDWGIVRLVTKHVPNLAGEVIGGLAQVVSGENPVQVVADKISKQFNDAGVDPETHAELMEQLAMDLEAARLRNEDRANARNMQIMAMNSKSWLARNFVYIFASALLVTAIGLTVLLLVYEVPEGNKTLVDVAFTVIFGTGLIGAFSFFFGDTETNKLKRP